MDTTTLCLHIPIEQGDPQLYGTPWAGRIVSWTPAEMRCDYGTYISDCPDSYVEVMAAPGDLVYYGCPDYLHPDDSVREYGLVNADGSLRYLTHHQAYTIARHTL